MEETKPEFLPCPFCGASPHVRRSMEEYAADDVHPAGLFEAWVTAACDECGIEMGAEYRSELVEAWNRRTSPTQSHKGE